MVGERGLPEPGTRRAFGSEIHAPGRIRAGATGHGVLIAVKRNITLAKNESGQPRKLLIPGVGRIEKRKTMLQKLAF